MSLKPTSSCGRVVRRHVLTSCDYIWTSDSALTSAFDRYCAISRTSVRHGSSVPGPMENRRRLGKRHMGELNFGQSQAGVPFWELANTVDLTQWKWQPPTLQDTPQQNSQAPSTKRLTLNEMISNWLSNPENPDIVEDTLDAQDLHTEILMPKETLPTTWNMHTRPQDIVDQGLDCILQDMSLTSTLSTTPNFSRFCNILSQSLSEGWFSDEYICFISRHVREGLVSALERLSDNQKQRCVDNLRLQLSDAMIDGLSVRVSDGRVPFESCTWDDLLLGISEIRRNSLRAFNKAMTHIPKLSLNAVSSGILANLDAYFIAMGTGTQNGTLKRQANKLASALQKLDTDLNINILADTTKKVSYYVGSTHLDYERIRSSWLHVLARMPNINQKYLAQICVILEADKIAAPITRLEIGRLFLAQCRRRKNSNLVEVGHLYHTMNRTDPNNRECYAELCREFWKTDQFQHMRGLCRFLQDLGRPQDLFLLVRGFNNLVKNHATPLATLAIGIGDPGLAIKVTTLYADSVKHQRGEFWQSDFGEAAMKKILANRVMFPRKMFDALGMFRKKPGRVKRSRRAGTPALEGQQIWKVARLAHVLAKMERLSNRTRFSLLTLCIHYLRYHHARLPFRLVQALIYNITRDLAQGNPGKTIRIKWMLRQASRNAGPELAYRLALAVERWRRQNFGLGL